MVREMVVTCGAELAAVVAAGTTPNPAMASTKAARAIASCRPRTLVKLPPCATADGGHMVEDVASPVLTTVKSQPVVYEQVS
jgi:hypothetical protein